MPSRFLSSTGYTKGATALTVTAGAYSDLDCVGGLIKFDFDSAIGGALLNQVAIFDDDNQSAIFDLYLFHSEPQTINDNAAFASALTFASLSKLIAPKKAIATYTTINSNNYAFATFDKTFVSSPDAGINTIWAYLVLNGSTPTYSATTAKLVVRLDLLTEGR